jgi:hypothetical protein
LTFAPFWHNWNTQSVHPYHAAYPKGLILLVAGSFTIFHYHQLKTYILSNQPKNEAIVNACSSFSSPQVAEAEEISIKNSKFFEFIQAAA